MKLQKTILAVSLAALAGGVYAAGETPTKDLIHHATGYLYANTATNVQTPVNGYFGNYAKVYVNTTGGVTTTLGGGTVFAAGAAPGVVDANGNVVVGGVTYEERDAVNYFFEQIKSINNLAALTALDTAAAAALVTSKTAELNAIYAALDVDGVAPTGSIVNDFYDIVVTGGTNRLNEDVFMNHILPKLDIHSFSNVGGVFGLNQGNALNVNFASPVYGTTGTTGGPVTIASLKSISRNAGLGVNFENGIDLNSRKAIVESKDGQTYQIHQYGTGANARYRFITMDNKEVAYNGAFFTRTGDTFTIDPTANVNNVSLDSVDRGGQVKVNTISVGEEIKVISDEHLSYGFRSNDLKTGINGGLTDVRNILPTETITANTIVGATDSNDKYDYINVGVIGNTYHLGENESVHNVLGVPDNDEYRADHFAHPEASIYGVNARLGKSITTLTGNGLSLSNINGTDVRVNFDGSVTRTVPLNNAQQGALASFFYENVNGKTLVKVDSAPGASTPIDKPIYYWQTGGAINGTLELASESDDALEALIANRTVSYTGNANTGANVETKTEHNVVTNTMVKYSEEVSNDNQKFRVRATNTDGTLRASAESPIVGKSYTSSIESGIIGTTLVEGNLRNLYGVKIIQNDASSKLTAQGLKTTGFVDAEKFLVGGKDVTEFLKTGVAPEPTDPTNPGTGTGGVTETQVNTKVEAAKTEAVTTAVTEAKAYTDTKVEGAIKTASADVTATATKAATDAAVAKVDALNKATLASAQSYTDAAVNKVSKRLDDVEKTANAGVAIALAAQQAVPNVQPGQVAVFGGVGHYEGETAVSLGAVTSFTDRISGSGAVGVADGSFGARVGISYLFGGK